MAYSSTNLALAVQMGGPIGLNLWVYDTTDTHATVDTAGYITDALVKGMAKGDLVFVRVWTSAVPDSSAKVRTAAASASVLSTCGWHAVMGISTAGAADLGDVTAVTVTNTD
jgi:hypothetical protein